MGTSSLAVKETLMPWAAHCDAVFQAEWCINITLENFVQQPSFCCLDRDNENKVVDLLCCHILYKPISKNKVPPYSLSAADRLTWSKYL